MCLSCEMAVRWFAEMEEAARRAAAPTERTPANAEVAAEDGGGRTPHDRPAAAADGFRRSAAPERAFVCEPARGEGE